MIIPIGGKKSSFGYIGATYPSGSILTCTKDNTIFTAEDTSGKYIFALPEAGSWIIKSENSAQSISDSETISLTDENTAKEVILRYNDILYNAGDARTAITGGWNNKAVTSGTSGWTAEASSFNTSNVVMNNSGSTGICAVSTKNKISFSGFTTLKIRVTAWQNLGNGFGHSEIALCTSQTLSSINSDGSRNKYYKYANIGGTGTISLNISGVADNTYYVWVFGSSRKMTFDKIWLE